MNAVPNCVITGATGYVGSRIVNYLRGQGIMVCEMRRTLPAGSGDDPCIRPFSLGESLDGGILSGFEILVHCAYDLSLTRWEEIERVNVRGSMRLFEAARSAGVKRIVFLSSLSAFEGCRTMYGRAKLAIERMALAYGAVVVRPGLVYDTAAGGLFGAISRFIQVSPVVPLIGSTVPIYVCHSRDLARLIYELCTMQTTPQEPIVAASETPLQLKEIVSQIAISHGRKPLLVTIPARLVYLALRALELAGWHGRLNSERVLGLLNSAPNVDFAATRRLHTRFRTFVASTGRASQ